MQTAASDAGKSRETCSGSRLFQMSKKGALHRQKPALKLPWNGKQCERLFRPEREV